MNESNPFSLFSSDQVQRNIIRPNLASAIILVDPAETSSFTGTLTLYISNEQSVGQFSVYCRVSIAQSVAIVSTTFSVLGIRTTMLMRI